MCVFALVAEVEQPLSLLLLPLMVQPSLEANSSYLHLPARYPWPAAHLEAPLGTTACIAAAVAGVQAAAAAAGVEGLAVHATVACAVWAEAGGWTAA